MSQHTPEHELTSDPASASGEEDVQTSDSGQQALSDALRVSFAVLKIAMLVLLVFYLTSGFFIVNEGEEQVIRLRFGSIVGDEQPAVYESDWHFGLPYPIEEQLSVPTTSQTLSIQDAFWYEGEQNQRREPLDPTSDGYLLTGDGGIVHARFRIDYAVTDAVAFVRNVDGLSGTAAQSAAAADRLVRSVAEHALTRAVAQQPADAVVSGNANTGRARVIMQQTLDAIDSGIGVQNVSIQGDPTMPGPVQQAYQAVTTAENEKERQIENARNERERLLVGAAGSAALAGEGEGQGPLLRLIERYQTAVRADEDERASQLDDRLAEAYRSLQVTGPDGGGVRIGGEAASVITQARGYADEVEQQLRSERTTFLELNEEFQKNPRILISRIWQEAREAIFTGDGVETMYTKQGRPYIVVNRDPSVQQQRSQQGPGQQNQQGSADQGR